MLRTVIIDDEVIAREGLRALLAADAGVEVIGEAAAGAEAVDAVRRLRPDLVFLDVQMPDLDGFGVLARLAPAEMPAVVFVTAYDGHALRAFDVSAVDYLLKPFDRDRLARALERVRRHLAAAPLARVEAEAWRDRDRRILVRDRGRVHFVEPGDVEWIEGCRNYVRLLVGGRPVLVRETMTALEGRLDPGRFLRVNRSVIVNVERVRELRYRPNGQIDLVLHSRLVLRASRRYRARVREFFAAR